MRSLSERAAREGLSNPRALQYPGPRPRSRETAIVMIGDQVEATARVRQPQTRDECLTLARESVARIMADEQLVYSGLTLAELDLIEQAFAETLHAIHHRRLGYAFSDVTPSALVRQELEARPLLPTDA
jgi:hypothetical protein